MRGKVTPAAALLLLALAAGPARAQKERPPHGQDTVPGPALSPQEAIKKMRVPPGFAMVQASWSALSAAPPPLGVRAETEREKREWF